MNAYNRILSVLRTGKQPSNNGVQPTKTNEADDLAHAVILLESMQRQIADQQKQIDALNTKMNETDDLARATILLELMKDQIADQQKQIDGLDTKASVILAAATVLAGAAAALFPGLISNHATILTNSHIWWLLPTLVCVYVVLVCFACLAYTVRRYKRVPDPQYLFDQYPRDAQRDDQVKKQATKRQTGSHCKQSDRFSGRAWAFCCSCTSSFIVSSVNRA
jgi:hypothetical protein